MPRVDRLAGLLAAIGSPGSCAYGGDDLESDR
jgi:hypothetical protein